MIIAIAMTAKESDDKSQIRSMATDKQISDLSTPTYLYYHNHHHITIIISIITIIMPINVCHCVIAILSDN